MSSAEFHQLDLQLQRIRAHLANELGGEGCEGHLTQQLAAIREDIHTLQAHLLGTPESPGLLTRLDRLETAERVRAKINSAALCALVSLVIKAGWELLTR